MEGVRVGNKKPSMSISKSVDCVGKAGCSENTSKHKPAKSPIGFEGEAIHGKPLFSAASKSVE